MLEVFSWGIVGVLYNLFYCYFFNKISDNEKKFSVKNVIFTCIIYSIINCYTITYDNFMRAIIINLCMMFILKFCYNKSWVKTIFSELLIYFLFVIGELIFSIFFIGILNVELSFFTEEYIGIILSNIFIISVVFCFSINKFIVNKIKIITNYYQENNFLNFFFKIIIAAITISVLFYPISQNSIDLSNIIIRIIIFIAILIFVSGYFNEKSGNNKLTIEYDQLLDYVKTYEDEVVDKSKKQHEYKNQLIIIDDMIPKTNKKAKDYLKKVLNNVEDVTDNDWLVKLKNLPSGGIKGLIHFKIKKMIENKISVYVDIDKKLSKKDNWINVDKNLEDISRILGVYLDNAIEAATKANDRQIIIEFINKEENIEFILSNSYSGNINFNDIDREGYSTKGKNRGVGLSLVKDIIKNNKLLSQSREVNGKFYVQKLYIKK